MDIAKQARQYVYPAIFTPPRGKGERWSVRFPDLAKNEKVKAKTLEVATLRAHDILKAYVRSAEQHKHTAHLPAPCESVTVGEGEILQYVVVSLEWPGETQHGRKSSSFFVNGLVIFIFLGILLMSSLMSASSKPVIYLYPEKSTEVSVRLKYNGTLTHTWPPYQNREKNGWDGWKVTAQPDGTLFNHADGREYSYLFWEGDTKVPFDFNTGFVVKGSDTGEFLREKLAFMGLTPREYNEFIVYWLPLMEANAYNLISFQGEAYTDNAVLTVVPQPDSVLRVYMAYKPLSSPIEVSPQELKPFHRKGFTLVEWGGSEVK